jgi:hypothetical protein
MATQGRPVASGGMEPRRVEEPMGLGRLHDSRPHAPPSDWRPISARASRSASSCSQPTVICTSLTVACAASAPVASLMSQLAHLRESGRGVCAASAKAISCWISLSSSPLCGIGGGLQGGERIGGFFLEKAKGSPASHGAASRVLTGGPSLSTASSAAMRLIRSCALCSPSKLIFVFGMASCGSRRNSKSAS